MNKNGYIGFLDYGIGGISLLTKAIEKMPSEKYIYIRDSFFLSGISQTRVNLINSCLRMCNFLVEKGVEVIVISCDTATMIVIDELKERLDIPLIGMYPAIIPVLKSQNVEEVVILAAEETFYSRKFNEMLKINQDKKRIYKLACPEIISLLEKGIFKGNEIETLIEDYFKGFDLNESTTLLLGSGYYSLIAKTLKKVLGGKIKIIDSGVELANNLCDTLNKQEQTNSNKETVCEIYNLINKENIEQSSFSLNNEMFDKFGDSDLIMKIFQF